MIASVILFRRKEPVSQPPPLAIFADVVSIIPFKLSELTILGIKGGCGL